MKSLIAILSASLCLLCWGADLSAQEKKEDKKWEITGYFGAGRAGNIGGFYPEGGRFSPFNVPCYGLGMEYYLTPRISFEAEINYLPNSSRMVEYLPHPELIYIWDEGLLEYTIIVGTNYRLFGAINFLFYLTTLNNENIATVFLTVGTGYQYDRVEFIVVSRPTL